MQLSIKPVYIAATAMVTPTSQFTHRGSCVFPMI